MTKITIICGFGVISVIDFRDDIVRKVSDFMPGANLGEIKEVRRPAEYPYFEDVSQKPALKRSHLQYVTLTKESQSLSSCLRRT